MPERVSPQKFRRCKFIHGIKSGGEVSETRKACQCVWNALAEHKREEPETAAREMQNSGSEGLADTESPCGESGEDHGAGDASDGMYLEPEQRYAHDRRIGKRVQQL